MKKEALKQNKMRVTGMQDTMKQKFENVAKAKQTTKSEYNDKMEKIHERRLNKEKKKEQVLENVNINHQMLQEVHKLRAENVKNNL